MEVFSLMKAELKGKIVRRKHPSTKARHGKRLMPRTCGDTDSYSKGIAEAEWIFSRGERLLLAATGTTSEMPGGILRLVHGSKYKQLCRKVKNS
jgi:hypothetical protein